MVQRQRLSVSDSSKRHQWQFLTHCVMIHLFTSNNPAYESALSREAGAGIMGRILIIRTCKVSTESAPDGPFYLRRSQQVNGSHLVSSSPFHFALRGFEEPRDAWNICSWGHWVQFWGRLWPLRLLEAKNGKKPNRMILPKKRRAQNHLRLHGSVVKVLDCGARGPGFDPRSRELFLSLSYGYRGNESHKG